MKKYPLSLLLALACATGAGAQTVNDSKLLLLKGRDLQEEGKFREALRQYHLVPPSDTNYHEALYMTALSAYQDSAYAEARNYCREGLALRGNEYEPVLYKLLSSTYDMQDSLQEAVRVLDSGLLTYPASAPLRLAKVGILLQQDRLKEAGELAQTLLIENPFFADAHFRLGQVALKEGRMVPALLSFFGYLLNEPDGGFRQHAIGFTAGICEVNEDTWGAARARTSPDPVFSSVEKILASRIALDEGYKLKAGLDDKTLRQIQVVMEKLAFRESEKDFFMQFYVPLYRKIWESEQFEAAAYRAFSSLPIPAIQSYVKKNDKRINGLISTVVEVHEPLRLTRVLDVKSRAGAPSLYHFNDGSLFAKVRLEGENFSGPSLFYYPNGNVKAKGTYNADGEKNGRWEYFSQRGALTGVDHWKEGVQVGEDLIYNELGVPVSRSTFADGKRTGTYTLYHPFGGIREQKEMKDDKEHGKYVEYYSNGRLKIRAASVMDSLDGPYEGFFNNGRRSFEGHYKVGKLHGPYISYHENGTVEAKGIHVDGTNDGRVETFGPNGKLQLVEIFRNGLQEGEELQYNGDGQLIQKVPYSGGKAHGLAEYYDRDGKLFSTFEFEQGKLMKARYFDKAGKEIASSTRQRGRLELNVHNPEGFRVRQSFYDAENEPTGKHTIFFPSGKVSQTTEYKDGLLNGKIVSYHENGNKEYEGGYEAGERSGAYTNYHPWGAIESQYHFMNGEYHGTRTERDVRGNEILRTPYQYGTIHGTQQRIHPNGKLEEEEDYFEGGLMAIRQYDTLGKLYHTARFELGNGAYKGLYPNGKTMYEGKMVNGMLQGTYTAYYFDGSRQFTRNFDTGLVHGAYKQYFYGGGLATEGQFDKGQKTGTWTYYTSDGKKERTEMFRDDELNGKVTYFYPQGGIERELEYAAGLLHGTYRRFSADGNLGSEVYYHEGSVYGYAYPGTDGKLLPLIPLKGGAGQVKARYANGQPSLELTFVDGKLNGPYRVYHSNGKLYYESNETYSLSNGRLAEYFPNGQVAYEVTYVNDQQEGWYRSYHANGKLKEEIWMQGGTVHGPWTMHNEAGKVTEKRQYYWGTLYSSSK